MSVFSAPRGLPAVLALVLVMPILGGCGDKDKGDDDSGSAVGGGVGGEGSGGGDGGDGGGVDTLPCVDENLGSSLGAPVSTGSTSGEDDDYSDCYGGSDSGEDPRPDGDEPGPDEAPPDTGDWPDDPDSGDWEASSGPDKVFQWTAPAAGTYTISTRGSVFDTTLAVMDNACDGSIIDCDDDGGVDLDSRIVVTVGAGDTLIIVLDGYDAGSSGNYVLNIEEGNTGGGGDDSGWSDGSDGGWDSGIDVGVDAGSWVIPGVLSVWFGLLGLGGALLGGARKRD